MLELRPGCEHCDAPLPPSSTEAMICTFECTFCSRCVTTLLSDVCPNCGGGFSARPIRPAREWKVGASVSHYPASTAVVHRPVDLQAHETFSAELRSILPKQR